MMSVAGSYECVLKSPMGDQKSTMTVNVDGDTWSGDNVGAQGSITCNDGKVDGNTITWSMDLTVPMPMKLEGTATIDGDDLTGSVKAGAFGSFPLSGKRVG
jgi:hypothetical protein